VRWLQHIAARPGRPWPALVDAAAAARDTVQALLLLPALVPAIGQVAAAELEAAANLAAGEQDAVTAGGAGAAQVAAAAAAAADVGAAGGAVAAADEVQVYAAVLRRRLLMTGEVNDRGSSQFPRIS